MRMTGTVLLCALLVTTPPAAGQGSVEVYGGGGFTGVDVDEWAGTAALDWEQVMSEAYFQIFLLDRAGFSLGAEVGYAYLLWYEIPYGTYNLQRDVDATRAMAVARGALTEFLFAEAALGFYFFDGFTDPAAALAVGGRIPVGSGWHVPVRLRATTIFDSDAAMIPVGVSIGVAYDFGG